MQRSAACDMAQLNRRSTLYTSYNGKTVSSIYHCYK